MWPQWATLSSSSRRKEVSFIFLTVHMLSFSLHSCSPTIFPLVSWFLLVCSLSFSSLFLCSQSYCPFLRRILIACSYLFFLFLVPTACSRSFLLFLVPPARSCSLILLLVPTACSYCLFPSLGSFCRIYSLFLYACSFTLLLLLDLIDLLIKGATIFCSNVLFLQLVLLLLKLLAQRPFFR